MTPASIQAVPGGAPAASWHGRVLATDGARYAVACAAGRYWLKPAASCLLQPAVGDLVLVSLAGGVGYVLAVLERAETAEPATLRLPGEARLEVPEGALHLSAAGGVTVEAGPSFELRSAAAHVAIGTASLAFGELDMTGERSHAVWRQRTDVARERLDVSLRHEARTRDSVRSVSGHDEQRAGSQRLRVEGTWSTHAAQATLTAEHCVTLDATRLRLG